MTYRCLLAAITSLLAVLALACDDGDGNDSSPTAASRNGSPTAAFEFDCSSPPAASEPDSAAFPVDITDGVDNTISLDAPPQRIASLSAGHTEMLYAIGAGDQVAAVDNTSDCPDAANDLAKVDAFTPSVEAIADLQPDLVVIFFDPDGTLQPALQDLGIPVLNLPSPESVGGVYEQTALLGKATGHSGEATQVVEDMQESVEDIRAGLRDVTDPPSVFHEVDINYYSAGPGSFIGDLYDILGAENIAAATGEAYPLMSAEAIVAADPDVIILADEDAGESPDTVKARDGWAAIAAVESDRIYVVDPDIVSRPGPRLIEALLTLAEFLYPGELG